MLNFGLLPVRRISLRDCTWPDHDIQQDHLVEPERRRDIDDIPICVELLVSGHWFIHDGRHRALRALARGEHEIYAYAYTEKEGG